MPDVRHKKSPLRIDPREYIRDLQPPADLGMPPLVVSDYYRTSGEATQKTNQLILDIGEYIPAILAREDTEDLRLFAREVHEALDEARQFLEHLIIARGPSVLLECYPDDGQLILRRVDPRNRDIE